MYALVGADEKPVYIGRTRRPLPARLRSHRSARNALWLKACNEQLAAWLEVNHPVAVILDEVTDPAAEWPTEKAWIEKYAPLGLLNKRGNPDWSPKRCGGIGSPSAAAA